MKPLCLFLICLFLASCGPLQLKTNVQNFSDLPQGYIGKKVAVLASPEEINKSLDWNSNKLIFENHFRKQGFVISNLDAADYVASVTYESGNRQDSTYIDLRDVYKEVGKDSYGKPIYEVFRTDEYTITTTRYTRTVEVLLVEKGSDKKIFESKATSTGPCALVGEVMHEMAESIFKKFPAGSGAVTLDKTSRECTATPDVELLTDTHYNNPVASPPPTTIDTIISIIELFD